MIDAFGGLVVLATSGRFSVIRRLVVFAVLLCVLRPLPLAAASKEMDRLQIQIASLQGQVADLMRLVEDNQKEIRRLNELLAEQSAAFKKSLQEQHTQGESVTTTLREVQERLSEVTERIQGLRAVAPSFGGGEVPSPAGTGPLGGATAVPGGPPSPGPAAPSTAAPPAPRELYSQAYADFARGNYDLAIQGFTEYIKAYPSTDFTDNAQYWIGECLYGKQKYQDAIEAWNVLFRDYPASDKLPDARVKKGMALEKLGRRSQALVEYRFVIDRFPNSSAARIARERLNP
jgi:tol-pal system protein YbgF